MDAKKLREDLRKLYTQYWDDYIEKVRKTTKAAFPYLIVPRDSYCVARHRIMICGQETKGWVNKYDGRKPEEITPEMILAFYDCFVNGKARRSPYWNFNRRTEKAFPEMGFVYNNIVKAGKIREAGCDDHINSLMLEHFPVFKEELRILKPDIIVFHTGFDYDERIGKVLGPFTATRVYEIPRMDILHFDDPDIPICVRTYHPGYLQRIHKYKQYSEALIQLLNELI